eukprot:GILI01018711.1.p2 GENE.GILI01018711.1~~GILI01018711.1.p2  ORF type:complete len:143 (+),score=22.35 GILI01018711.1:63-431(+)
MAQVTISAPNGTVLFHCKGGSHARTNLPDLPSPPIEVSQVPHAITTTSYVDVQKQMDDLHTKTMEFFAKLLKTGGTQTNVASPIADDDRGAEEDEDGGQLDLDTEGGAIAGKRNVGEKADRD